MAFKECNKWNGSKVNEQVKIKSVYFSTQCIVTVELFTNNIYFEFFTI